MDRGVGRGHVLELAISDVFEENVDITWTIDTISSLLVLLGHEKTYEALISSHKRPNETGYSKMYQPKTAKEMKFVSHALSSIVNFANEFSHIVTALEIWLGPGQKQVVMLPEYNLIGF